MSNLPPDAIAALDQGDIVEAIQRVRRFSGFSVEEARDAVDRYRNGDRQALASVAAASAASAASSARTDAAEHGDSIFSSFHDTTTSRVPGRVNGAAAMLNDPMAEPGRVRGSAWGGPLLWSIAAVAALVVWSYVKG